ncbi:hypothetical protein UFOVP181_9 [uncultured Caudovirales phage]|uniref:Uncharacterized protein n=1 Tax=uncultured Caudovirales phage TaxID=2100421 RepID=A0A6J7WDX5_9CAUD|nr:hypothetical protein UFOVP57_154 [uncultured Caudovirales phage]CAB5208389.1 hypothetical protein UFOVP181_9 [uncultured Caudovirales phage]
MNYQVKSALSITGIALLVILFVIIIGLDVNRTSTAMDIAKSNGCEYIGSARDLTQVKFFDCNGKIEMVRVK